MASEATDRPPTHDGRAAMKLMLASPTATAEFCDTFESSSRSCFQVEDYKNYPWKVDNGPRFIRYQDIINYGRSATPRGTAHRCVMCGLSDVCIPTQNKDVCKQCDSAFWYWQRVGVVLKFCKGCKNFVALGDFDEKPEASKCGRCRHRGRLNYFSKKRSKDSTDSLETTDLSQPSTSKPPIFPVPSGQKKRARELESTPYFERTSSIDSNESNDESISEYSPEFNEQCSTDLTSSGRWSPRSYASSLTTPSRYITAGSQPTPCFTTPSPTSLPSNASNSNDFFTSPSDQSEATTIETAVSDCWGNLDNPLMNLARISEILLRTRSNFDENEDNKCIESEVSIATD